MPVRRASAAGATQIHNPGRVHRSNGSNTSVTASSTAVVHSSPYSASANGASASMPPQQKMTNALVNRLRNKLPCYSGTTLPDLENDEAIQQTVESLMDIARDSLDIVAWSLTELLEKLHKNTDASGFRMIEVLQSQLFILKVLSIAMACRWRRRAEDGRPESSISKRSVGPPSISSAPGSPAGSGYRIARGRQTSSEHLGSMSPWVEPPPLDETCARYILSVMVMFLRQAAPPQQRLMSAANLEFNASYHDLESIESIEVTTSLDIFHTGPAIPPTVGSYYPKADATRAKLPLFMRNRPQGMPSIRTAATFPQHSVSYERTSATLCSSILSMNTLIAKFSGRVVYHLSASNWPVVFHRIKTKIHVLASTGEEDPDIMDVQLMTHCWLDRARLVQLLQELSSLLVNMRRDAQTAVAGPLRTAVWNWIEYHQEELDDAQRHHRRLEGTPERVFDLLYQMVDTSNKAAVWPALTVLMCISNDRIKSEYDRHTAGGIPTPYSRKDRGFAQVLTRTMMHQSKAADVAMICILDVCRAASRTQPGDEVPLQAMAGDLAHEIRSVLGKWGGSPTAPKAFWESPDEIDVALIADALATIFRFLPQNDSVPIIMQALQPEMSDAVKISAIKACITLVTESPRIPWQKPLDDLKAQVMPRLYGIFHSSITRRSEVDANGLMKKANYRPKAKRYTTETLPDRELAIHATMALWRADVSWFLDGLEAGNESRWMPQCIEQWQAQTDSSIKYGLARTIRYVQEGIRNSPMDSPAFTNGSKWMMHCGSGTMTSFGLALLVCRTDFRTQRMWMDMAHELLYRFTRTTMEKVRAIQLTPERVPAFAIAEIAFMVTLTSAERNASATAAQCLRLIAGAERQKGNAPAHLISEEEKARRYPVYEQLGDPKAMVLGRVADQKRIRKLMRILAIPSPAHIAVWQECYWRWRTLKEMSERASMDHVEHGQPQPVGDNSLTAEERQAQWHNLTLFLASFGATCLADAYDPSALAAIIPQRYLPDSLRVLRDSKELLKGFISELIDILGIENIQARDLAREALSTEAHPKIYPTILEALAKVLNDVTESPEIAFDDFVVFFDQFTVILKVIIENASGGEELRGMDIMATLLLVAKFITRTADPAASYRLKVKFCALCDSYLDQAESFSARKDAPQRIAIADYVVEWALDPASSSDPETVRTIREINIATLRTSVKLFDRLDLQPVDAKPEESAHNVPSLFIRYSGFLLKLLRQFDPAMQEDSLSEQTSFSQSRLSARDIDLREMIINGLASLISANTEIGIKHCLPMTYNADLAHRVVYAHVFARVVAKGIRFDPQEAQPVSTKQSRLCELMKSDSNLALAICQVCPSNEADQIITVLLTLFDTRSGLMNLMKAMIDKEIASTENEASLFRGNSICTRFLSAFARVYGYNYLRNLILPLIRTMKELPPGHSYDLDPSKAPNANLEQNKEDLIAVATAFLEIVLASAPAIPSMFREICAHIGKSVNEIWPEAKFQTLGAFIFLRFISPAIVNPGLVDVEVPPDPVLRRGLMNIAKIMQNLANNIFFGKEVHMTPLNSFLQANIVNVTRYLSEINKYTPPEDGHEEWLDTPFDETDAVVLQRFFDRHTDKVGKELLSTTQPDEGGDDELASGTGKKLWNSICTALVEASNPFVFPPKSLHNSDVHKEYIELMQRFHYRDTTSIQHLFTPAVTPSDEVAVFVLSVSKIDVEALDLELLLHHIFKTLTSPVYVDRDFDIVFDWTAFAPGSQIPVHWLKMAYELIPADICKRFKTARMLTPNALALRYMRRLYNLTGGIALSEGYTMHTSTSELLRNYSQGTSLSSLYYAFEQEDEPGDEFHDVYMRHNLPMRVPVMMRVNTTHLLVVALKAIPISHTLSSRATEIISFSDISDVYNVSTGQEANEFIIRKIRHGSTLYFTSVDRDAIVKAIRAAKGSMKVVQKASTDRFKKLSNVIATLLHIGMVNIGSDNEELRVASYELLCSVCTYLDFEGKPVVPTKAVFVPGRASAFVSQLSEKLAGFAPHLTLDFIQEVANGMDKTSVAQRISCMQYMSPWIRNLPQFTDPANPLYDHSGAKVRDCVRCLIDMSVGDQEIHSVGQKYIWRDIGDADSDLVNIVVDELMRAAVDGGIGSQRCETVADTLSALRSIHVRGRVLARIRKVLGKTSQPSTRTLAENQHWNELACLIRLTLMASYLPRHPTHAQIFVPECAHIVSLVAGTGQLLVRTSVYGIVINQLHSTFLARSAQGDANGAPEIQALLDEFASPEIMKLFGLIRPTPTSDYAIYDPLDRNYLETLEALSLLLDRFIRTLAGPSKGILNVWRARWMGLVTSSAFQVSPAVQVRAFVTLSTLASSDVDDDLLYQMLVALKSAFLSYSDLSDTTVMVSMLRCIRKVVLALPPHSRYLSQLFWLAVVLLQTGHMNLYDEAVQLLRVSLERMHNHGWFKEHGVAETLLEGRAPLEDVTNQIDGVMCLSFKSNFSFALAAIIFKGIRHQVLKEHAEGALRSLLRITVQSSVDHNRDGPGTPICSDALGYFIALIPLSTSVTLFKTLLEDAQADRSWFSDEVIPGEEEDDPVARVPFALLGIYDSMGTLYVAAFITAILGSAQGDDTETELLFNIMSDIANGYPDTISATFDCLQEKIKAAFATASNTAILAAASNVFRAAMTDPRHSYFLRGSASTLGTVDELNGQPRNQLAALEEQGMGGLINNFGFVQNEQPQHVKMIRWVSELVAKIIE